MAATIRERPDPLKNLLFGALLSRHGGAEKCAPTNVS